MRLTVHIEDAPFIQKEQKIVATLPNGGKVLKPKNPKCIHNTLSFKNLKGQKEINQILGYIKSQYKVATWKSGKKKGQEMVYISGK
jgi:hypothetical protein